MSAFLPMASAGWAVRPFRKLRTIRQERLQREHHSDHSACNVATGPATQAAIVRLGGSVVREFKLINGGSSLIPSAALSQLKSNFQVQSVDREIHHELDLYGGGMNANAPGANLVNLGVLEASGSGSDSNVIAAIESASNSRTCTTLE